MNKLLAYPLSQKLLLPVLITLFSWTYAFGQAPIVTSFSPSSGPIGTTVTITGTGFAPTAASNIVFFGATKATVTTASTTSLTVTVPAGATYHPITVLNGVTALAGYSDQPFVTTFTPNKGNITTADFMPPVTFDTGSEEPADIAISDIDGDGKPDIIIANYNLNTISVLRNTSVTGAITTSSFAPKVDFATGNHPLGLVVADLDGDGKPDMAVINNQDNTLSVFHNISTAGSIVAGSFAAPITFSAGVYPVALKVGDLDGDGKPDLVVVSFTWTNRGNEATYTNTISVFRNTSVRGSITPASFAPGVPIFTGHGDDHEDLTIADLDGDGKPDIGVSLYIHGQVAVFRNTSTIGSINSTNSFAAPVYLNVGPTPIGPFSLTTGDLDGDGKLDLVVTNIGGFISVFRNTSTTGSITASSFAAPVAFSVPSGSGSLGYTAIGDLDGDGRSDLAVVSYDTYQTIAVFRNTSTVGSITAGSFAPRVDVPVGLPTDNIKIGDLDGDGKPDLIAGLGQNSNSTIAIVRNAPFFPPTIQATNIIFSNIATNSATINWTNGNGMSRAVFIAAGTTGIPLPVNRTGYTANTIYTSGTQIGISGWYCIYNGTGNTVNVTGLSSGATYRVMVVEYNGTAQSENYLTTTALGNPANVTTLAGGPITINAINLISPSLTNANSIQYQATFASNVTGLTTNDFGLVTTGTISGANITSVTGSGSTYTVTVNTGTGDGAIGLNLVNGSGLTPGIISPLPFSGQVCTVDRTAPAIAISAPSPVNMLSGTGQVTYTVTYTDANFNTSTLTASNITLESDGSATGTVSVSGSGTTYTITISGVTGSGTLGFSIAAGTASDLAGNTATAAGPSPTCLVAPVLSNLAINSCTLSPGFASGVTGYNASVGNQTSSILVTPVINDPNAKVTVNGGNASTPVNLAVGLNSIAVTVTTLDGSATTIYNIGVTRAGSPPNIAYGTGNIVITSAAPFSITPTNTGGPVPNTNYGQVSTFAGSPAETAGYINDTGTAAQFNWPQQAVMDAAGNLYVTDANNNAIRMISPSGAVTTFAGSLSGAAGFADGTSTASQFSLPDGITIDGTGNLYVSDYSNNAIRKITPTGVVTTLYTATSAFGPGGVCVDVNGNIIVTAQDASQLIKITPGGVASIIAGSTPGYTNGPVASAQFNAPGDVKIDAAGNLYVADFENNAIREITTGGMVTTIAGSAVAGNTPGFANGVGTAAVFNNPPGLYIGPGGIIYVADVYNNDIRAIMPDGTVSLVAGSAAQAPGDADGIGTAAGFNLPVYLYIDNNGTAYISELGGNRIRKMVLTGYTLKGKLPAGLAFDPTTGVISGNAAIPFTATTDTITAYNAFGYFTTVVTISYNSVSNIATLSNLQLSQGALTPAFATGTFDYTADETNSTASIIFTPTATDPNATIMVNGAAVTSGTPSAPIQLNVGPNTITTVVTAQDGTTKDTYTVIVTRAPSSDALLSNLTVSQGALSPAFSGPTTAYADAVPNSVTTITVTPTAEDNDATITVNGVPVVSGTASVAIPLNVGPNTITTVVTAQDGTTKDIYTVVVTRAASSDALLSNLIVSQGALTPSFSGSTTAYADEVPNSVTTISVTPTAEDNNATITVNGTPVTSGTASTAIPLNVGPNTVTTAVTAQDGTTKDTYTVIVTRAASSDALLSNLTVSEGTLAPAFNSSITAYADTVPGIITSITVTPTAEDSNATITVNGSAVASGATSGFIPLVIGTNTVTVEVTAQDGTTTKTYTVTIYKGEPPANIVANNVLTPNGDGKNDYWVIKDIELYPQNNVTVFDKGGRVVYTKHSYNNEWDGSFNGSPLAEGTYYFVVDLGPNLRKFRGYVSILRN